MPKHEFEVDTWYIKMNLILRDEMILFTSVYALVALFLVFHRKALVRMKMLSLNIPMIFASIYQHGILVKLPPNFYMQLNEPQNND